MQNKLSTESLALIAADLNKFALRAQAEGNQAAAHTAWDIAEMALKVCIERGAYV